MVCSACEYPSWSFHRSRLILGPTVAIRIFGAGKVGFFLYTVRYAPIQGLPDVLCMFERSMLSRLVHLTLPQAESKFLLYLKRNTRLLSGFRKVGMTIAALVRAAY
jgi:hypothetical protein